VRQALEESYRKLASMLAMAVRDQQFCSTLIGSAFRGEGSSTITLQVARELAVRHGLKPLVIEMDFQRPRLLKRYNLDPENTFYAVSEGLIPPADAIQSHYSGVDFIPCGRKNEVPKQDPAGTLSRIMEQARAKHNIILVDTPPLLDNGSVLTIASIVPRMILVVEAGKTSAEVLQQMKNELEQWHISLIGSVLNRQKRFMPRWLEEMVR
jgi:Mrp family chromosome partitioning ATPase